MTTLERALAKLLVASRWLLAPLYIGLVVGLVVLVVKALLHVGELATHIVSASESEVVLGLLGLIDLTLTGSLIVIVILSGYANFVSRIDASNHPDWPEWLSKINFAGLKLKLMSSIVAISAIQLLRAFMNIGDTSDRDLMWYLSIHIAFVFSGLLLALTNRWSGGEDH